MAQKPEFQVFLNQFHLGRKTELQTHQISSKNPNFKLLKWFQSNTN